MSVYAFEGKKPSLGAGAYVASSAEVVGDVQIGKRCFIGPGARIKGDYGKVEIGDETSVQENCVIHARPNEICRIGNHVTVGHGSILHTCKVEDNAVIGMGAIISDWSKVGEWSVVGEGAVVKQNQQVPANKIVVGVPAKIVGEVGEKYKKVWAKYKQIYAELAEKRYPKGLKKID